ncbi:MFS transporter [Quadrisphaera sp. KR29]|uniref:MFS transporter n=1 Tax=Quadrisphaera sp. KR29 TaxID=3461391 RepID=UPI004044E017
MSTTGAPTTASSAPTTRLPVVIYVIAVGAFLMGTSEFVLAGMLPSIATDFSTTIARAGLAITAFAVGMIVGAPVMALLTLRLSRRTTLVAALLVFAAGHVLAAAVPHFGVLLVARVLTGVVTGAFWAVGSVLAAQTAGPAASSRALGVVLGGGMLSYVLGVPLGSLTSQLVGWQGTFWGLAALATAAACVVARLVLPGAETHSSPSVRAEVSALRSGRLWLALATCAMVTFGVLSTYSFVAPLLTDRAGLPASAVPWVLMGFGAAAVAGNVTAGRLGDHHPYRTALVLAVATVLVSVALCLLSGSAFAAVVLFCGLGLVGLSANPIYVALAVRFGGEAPTLATAMPTSIFNLGTALGTAAAASALDSPLGALGPPLVGVVGAALVLVPLGLLAARSREHGLNPA